eukprot:7062560-Prymnesium_polylepis.1
MNPRCSTWTTRVPRRWPRTARAASAAATLSVATSRCASGWRTVTFAVSTSPRIRTRLTC